MQRERKIEKNTYNVQKEHHLKYVYRNRCTTGTRRKTERERKRPSTTSFFTNIIHQTNQTVSKSVNCIEQLKHGQRSHCANGTHTHKHKRSFCKHFSFGQFVCCQLNYKVSNIDFNQQSNQLLTSTQLNSDLSFEPEIKTSLDFKYISNEYDERKENE